MLPWDSAFFGFPVAQLDGDALTREQAADLIERSAGGRLRCVYMLMSGPPDVPAGTARLVEAGVRTVFRKELHDETLRPPAGIVRLRPPVPGVLRSLARSAHTDTRFFADGNFSPEKAAELYELWLTKSVDGLLADQVFAAGPREGPLGYATVRRTREGEANIGLIAVAPEARGRGLGRALVDACCAWAAMQAMTSISVVTKEHNAAACGLYAACGFSLAERRTWYHLWLNNR